MDVFGRSGADLAVLMEQGADGIRKAMDEAERLGVVFSKEQAAVMDEFNDKWAAMSNTLTFGLAKAFVTVTEAMEKYRSELEFLARFNPVTGVLGSYALDAMGGGTAPLPANASYTRPPSVTEATRVSGYSVVNGQLVPPRQRSTAASATGPAAKKAVKEVSDAERERALIIEMNRTAYEKYADGVQKANALLKDDQVELNRELARLQAEFTRSTQTGMEKAKESTDELAVSIRSSLANAFESALFEARGFEDGMRQILDGIARQIARKAFIDPLSNGIGDLIGSAVGGSGIGGLFGGFFAAGGRPPVGKASVVGENGPELFVPDSAGTVVPNGKFGGASVTVVQHNTFGSGVTRQEVYGMLPAIANASKEALLKDIQRGGQAAYVVGKRS